MDKAWVALAVSSNSPNGNITQLSKDMILVKIIRKRKFNIQMEGVSKAEGNG